MIAEMFVWAAVSGAGSLLIILVMMRVVADPEPLLDELVQGWVNAWQWLRRGCTRQTPRIVSASMPTLAQLERWDRQWTDLHLAGKQPAWVPGHGWMDQAECIANAQAFARREKAAHDGYVPGTSPQYRRANPPAGYIAPCVCGYYDECAVHCGDGHTTGRCPAGHAWKASPQLQTYGITVDVFAERIRQALGKPPCSCPPDRRIDVSTLADGPGTRQMCEMCGREHRQQPDPWLWGQH